MLLFPFPRGSYVTLRTLVYSEGRSSYLGEGRGGSLSFESIHASLQISHFLSQTLVQERALSLVWDEERGHARDFSHRAAEGEGACVPVGLG
jgi:hypothetical protein